MTNRMTYSMTVGDDTETPGNTWLQQQDVGLTDGTVDELDDLDLDAHTTSDIERLGQVALLIPVGSCEQHGPHLPLGTDTMIANELARRAAHRLRTTHRALVGPSITISSSGEHGGFVGTLSIGATATTETLVELARSADWAHHLIFVNGHGGNRQSLRDAVAQSHQDGRHHVTSWSPDLPGDNRSDAHAGWLETSVMLHLRPESVRADRLEPGAISFDVARLRVDGVRSVSSNGVLGDPRGASATDGEKIVAAWSTQLEVFVRLFIESVPRRGSGHPVVQPTTSHGESPQ